MSSSAVYSILMKKENAHDVPIYSCDWTRTNVTSDPMGPTREFIVTGGLDGLVKVWLVNNNRLELVHTMDGHTMAVVSVAYSPDGQSIASTSLDSILTIWDLLSGRKVQEMTLDSGFDVWKVAFSPNGKYVATGSHTGKVYMYGIKEDTVTRFMDTRGKFILSVAWCPDQKYLACGNATGEVHVFDVAHCTLVHVIETHRESVRSVAFSPDARMLASACDDGTVTLHSVDSAIHSATLDVKTWAVCVVWSPDGTKLAVSAADGTVRVCQAGDLKVLHTFNEHTDTVWEVRFNDKGDKLISISKDKCINIYECPLSSKPYRK